MKKFSTLAVLSALSISALTGCGANAVDSAPTDNADTSVSASATAEPRFTNFWMVSEVVDGDTLKVKRIDSSGKAGEAETIQLSGVKLNKTCVVGKDSWEQDITQSKQVSQQINRALSQWAQVFKDSPVYASSTQLDATLAGDGGYETLVNVIDDPNTGKKFVEPVINFGEDDMPSDLVPGSSIGKTSHQDITKDHSGMYQDLNINAIAYTVATVDDASSRAANYQLTEDLNTDPAPSC